MEHANKWRSGNSNPVGTMVRTRKLSLVAMKLRTGLTIGVAVGYVLGARAGHDRYDQIKRAAIAARKHPAIGQLGRQAAGLSDLIRVGVAEGLSAGSDGLRSVAETSTPELPQEVPATRG